MTAVLPGFQSETSSLQLRYYQAEAIAAAYQYLREHRGNPCLVLPTGAGKTPVMAKICDDAATRWSGRVLVLSHVKELIRQTADTLSNWYPHLNVGVYSAGLGKRERRADVTVAGIQSIYRRGCEVGGTRPFNLVLVDEAHRIPTEGDGMYRQLLDDLAVINPKVRVIGLTATPYRLKGGYVCGSDHFLNEICHETGVRELIAKGYLSALTSKQSRNAVDDSKFHVRSGEFVASEMEEAFGESSVVDDAVTEILQYTADRKSILMFCCGVAHARSVQERIERASGERCGLVTGETPAGERDRILEDFKAGRLRFLANVNVLTEGFDATRVDCVCLLRSTLSAGLYYQMVGRGLRLHDGKVDCLVLDFGGNVLRHGCIDAIKINSGGGNGGGAPPTRECPECNELCNLSLSRCPDCGYVFPADDDPNHEGQASDTAIISTQVRSVPHEITSVSYYEHTKKGADDDAPKTMRVTYYEGLVAVADEWVCVEHSGFAWEKAHDWWCERTTAPMPKTAAGAVQVAEAGALAEPLSIEVKRVPGERFKRITKYVLPEKPDLTGLMFVEEEDEWGSPRLVLRPMDREPGADDGGDLLSDSAYFNDDEGEDPFWDEDIPF